MSEFDWGPLLLTFRLSLVTTAVLMAVGIPLAFWLAFTRSRLRPVVDTLVSMPLVLPPSVLGFYLLMAFSPAGAFGRFMEETIGVRLVFSFTGLVIGSVLFSLPFMVHPVQTALSELPKSLRDASYTLGHSRIATAFRVLLPNIRPAVITGTVMSFAHTVGEFGVVLMIGGNIPGQTRVASIAIYDEVEALNYSAAYFHSFVLFAISFSILLVVSLVNRKKRVQL